MAAFVDQDQKWLVDCLTATLDTSRDVRSFAETSLHQASLQPGFGTALAKVTTNKEISFGLRQLSAVLLKQFIKQHWQEADENFVHPAVSASEKGIIRQLLPSSLDDCHGKIRTAISMAIASIAQHDWPEEWPELLPFLLKLISDQSNKEGVRGALKCLALLSDDLDDTVVPKLVPALFPYLHTIISSPQLYEKSLRAKALSVIHSCISILGSMSGLYEAETISLITPMVNSLMEHFSTILQPPVQSGDPDDWAIRMEVLKCLLQLIQNFPCIIEAQFPVVMAPLWQTFVSSLEAYNRSLIQGHEDSCSGLYDSDGTEKSIETFVIQIFEFLLTMVGNSRIAKLIEKNIKELAYYTIPFLQITKYQEQSWITDANQFTGDEDDMTYSCRVSGSLLLEEIITTFGVEGINFILDGVQKRFSESCSAKISGSPDWWRLREATLFALASVSEQLLEVHDSGLINVNLGNLIEQMITEDMGIGPHEYPFLHARAYSVVSKYHHVISRSISEQFLYAAIQAISSNVPPPAKVGACRSLSQLLPEANKDIVQPHIVNLFSSLAELLNHASDETLHLVLETLLAAVKAGHELSSSIEPMLSPVILSVWLQNISDPFVSTEAVEVLEAIKNAPGCMGPFVSRILPSVREILEKPQQQPNGLVAGSLDLLTMILKGAPVDVMKAVFDVCFNHVIQVILRSDDHGEMQNATECLSAFLSGGKQHLFAWSGNAEFTMKMLLDAASRLLDPNLESSGALFVGSYILQLILYLPAQMAPYMHELVTSIVRRMQSSDSATLKSSLIVVLARLVHLSSPDVDQFISMLLNLPADGHVNSFSYVMSEWTKLQGEIQGSYQIKVTTSALAMLLSTRNVELSKINVQGHLIKSDVGIKTRSKAKIAPEQWSVVQLPVKIFSLLSDTLVEIQEQGLGADEDSDWEEASESDLLFSSNLSSKVNSSGDHLDALAKAFDGSEDGNYEDELMKLDPLNKMKLGEFLRNFFVSLSNTDRSLFEYLEYLCQSLTLAQRKAVEKVLSS